MASSTTVALISQGMVSTLKAIYESGNYSDIKINCCGKVFHVHKSVLCQSSVFAKMMDNDFKEASTGVIELPNDEPFIVQKMLDFFYTFDYSDVLAEDQKVFTDSATEINPSSSIESQVAMTYDPLTINAKVYIIGDIYHIQELKDLAVKKYQVAVQSAWNSPEFSESLRLIYENTQEDDRDIKSAALRVATEYIKPLLDQGEFVDLLKQNGLFAFEVLSNIASNQTHSPSFCHNPSCYGTEALSCTECGSSEYLKGYPKDQKLKSKKKGKKLASTSIFSFNEEQYHE